MFRPSRLALAIGGYEENVACSRYVVKEVRRHVLDTAGRA
jgi:hypothetical protein